MGALHAGHLALVTEARRRAGFVVASVFVNPTQFGPGEDFTRYPRDLDGDVAKLAGAGADLVFAPSAEAMYPPGDETRVRVGGVSAPLEGSHRPGHFEGVATVVAKLFSAVGPCVAVFGRKDYQQLLVVRRMARDLLLPVEVVPATPSCASQTALAMSSRNASLSPEERARALAISRGLDGAARRFAAGERDPRLLESIARAPLEPAATSIDYIEVRDAGHPGPARPDRGARRARGRVPRRADAPHRQRRPRRGSTSAPVTYSRAGPPALPHAPGWHPRRAGSW